MEPSVAEEACFEAGVKFGTLYHQFAGTPLSPASADSLAAAMEAAIENQPHCREVSVSIRWDALERAIDEGAADYVEFTGEFAEVEIVVAHEGHEVVTRMAMADGYPLMRVESVRALEETDDETGDDATGA